ncbi:MAG: cell division protein ZapE, partial [Microbacterium sp.]|nr:cell division protein ZapE [Microbacterium sp.]
MSGQEMAAELVPPRQFAHASFDNYIPDPAHPSQAAARAALQQFAAGGVRARSGWGRRKAAPQRPGIYLDGGFGVGKTHLLAALWHASGGPKHFGTFIEYTALIGALGYQQAVALLRPSRLICIDEFELDDPGDTMMMTRLIADLTASGTRFAATSNTPPNALGEGRFAAADFMREIRAMADRFEVLRIDGEDYLRREGTARSTVATDAEAESA